jgi:glycosyltransferase involved in cell wall biosynthesis
MGHSLRWIFDGLVSDERIVVVPNGTPEPAATEVHRNGRKVLFFSNLAPRKGVEESLEAAQLVLEKEPSTDFLFVGNPRDQAFERKMLKRAAEFDQIKFLPAVDFEGKDRLLASASILLFPPVGPEGHPRVVLEALAAGLPVVTTDRGAIAETVLDGECGFVLEDPVPDQLAARLLTLLRDDDLRTRMSEAACLRYRERFTQEQADDRLADWLAGVSKGS